MSCTTTVATSYRPTSHHFTWSVKQRLQISHYNWTVTEQRVSLAAYLIACPPPRAQNIYIVLSRDYTSPADRAWPRRWPVVQVTSTYRTHPGQQTTTLDTSDYAVAIQDHRLCPQGRQCTRAWQSQNLRIKTPPSVALCGWATISQNQMQHGWLLLFGKLLWHYDSATCYLIPQNHMLIRVKMSKLKPDVEFQCGTCFFSETGSSDIWGADQDIWLKFGMQNWKLEVDLRWYGPHLGQEALLMQRNHASTLSVEIT